MNQDEMLAHEATLAEMRELGIPVVSEEQTTVEPEEEVKPEVVDETKQVPIKEVEKEEIDVKEYKSYKQTLKEELQKDFDEKLEKIKSELSKSTPNEEKAENLEEEAKKLALELNFDEAKTLALLKATRSKTESLSEEDRNALKDLREMKEEREELKQQQIVDAEWKELKVTTQFPNANAEQLAKAKETMEDLARSEKYADKEMDYILYKEKAVFDKILFSPKEKTFESGRRMADAIDSDEDYPTFSPNMTPAQFERYEKRMSEMADNTPREKMIMRTTDELGRSIERLV